MTDAARESVARATEKAVLDVPAVTGPEVHARLLLSMADRTVIGVQWCNAATRRRVEADMSYWGDE